MCGKRRAQQRALYAQQLQQEAQGHRTTFDAFGNKILVPVAAGTANPPAPYAPYGGCGSRRQRRCGANAYGDGSVAVPVAGVYAPVRTGCCGSGGGGGGYRRERRGGLISLVVGLIVEHYEKKKVEKREEEEKEKVTEGGMQRGVVVPFDRDGDEEVALTVAGGQKHELGADGVDAGSVKYRDVDEKGLDGLPSYEAAVSK